MDVTASPITRTECAGVSSALARVGDKWSVQVVSLLGESPRRFNEIKRQVEGISQRMLTLTLRGLERDGLVRRTVTPSIPPRVDYELTDLGRSLLEPVRALGAWAHGHLEEIAAARAKFDGNRAIEPRRAADDSERMTGRSPMEGGV